VDGVRTPGSVTEATAVTECGHVGETPGLQPGQVVGRYVVEETLGSGGMGFVVSARDPKLDRPVAIKVLFREDDKGAVWLRREAQALAALNHPSIVAVHDVGVIDGRPFIAMERVEGMTLRRWLDERKRSDAEILEVFVAAGRALAAAHEQGIVHCDFKPTNVMIRSGGGTTTSLADSICIMDFGLARLHGEASSEVDPPAKPSVDLSESLLSQDFTEFDKLQGTPKYMAPEQFAMLGVSPATDQYGFCIALYEALWRQSPFKGDSPSSRMSEQMCGAQPRPPSASRDQRRLIDPILRGLSPLPNDRWPSLDDLCDALVPPKPTRRAWVLIAGAGIGAAGVAAWLGADGRDDPCARVEQRAAAVWNDAERAEVGKAFAATQRSYATEAWARGEASLDEWISRWVSVGTEDCRATFERDEVSDRDYDAHAHCLSRQLQRFDAVIDVLHGVEISNVVQVLDAVAALPEPEGCLEEEVLERPSDPMQAALVDMVYEDIGRCQVVGDAGRAKDFEACAREVVQSATDTGDENAMLDARRLFAGAVSDTGRRQASRALFEALYFDASAAGRQRLAASAALAVAFRYSHRSGDLEQARKWIRHAEPMRTTKAGNARVLRINALRAHFAGEAEAAISTARDAVSLAEESESQELLASCLNTLGKVLNENRRPNKARVVYERALEVRRATRGSVHPLVATSLNNLATVLGDAGEYDAALAMLEESLAIRRELLPHHHRHIATGTANVAETLSRMGKHGRALVLHRESAEVFAAVEGEDSLFHALLQTRVAADLRELGRYAEAHTALDVALSIMRRRPRGDHERFKVETELALLQAAEGNRQAAVEFFESAVNDPLHERDLAVARAKLDELQD
jgi:tetratricopeptide (TPR) repeat protein